MEPQEAAAPAASAAAGLWLKSRQAGDAGQWRTGLRLAERALHRLFVDDESVRPDPLLHARILITLAYSHSELGRPERAAALLDEASTRSSDALPAVRVARGMLLVRTGRPRDAVRELDEAVLALRDARDPADLEDLSSALINRGLVHIATGSLAAARADTEAAGRVADLLAAPDIAFVAAHNLGYVRFLGGDLPGALDAMTAAAEARPDAAAGVPTLDRAKVLFAAGLIAEAREFLVESLAYLEVHRATADLIDAFGLSAEIDLLLDEPDHAKRHARRAVRLATTRGDRRAAQVAQLLELRADAMIRQRAPRSSGRPARRSGSDADRAARLAEGLAAAGLPEDATVARLLQAEALLDAGDLAAAISTAQQHSVDTPPSLGTRLLTRLVAARIELAADRRNAGLRQVRRGLDDLADFQARFGSQDMQSSAAVHGRALARLGLRTAVQTGSPAAILQWLERSRAASSRLSSVRPPQDPALAEAIGTLRVLAEQARQAALRGERDPAIDRQIDQLRKQVRSRSWTAGGTGAVNRPASLAAVQRALSAGGHRITIVAPFRGRGRFHALVITATTARYLVLDRDPGLEPLLHTMIGDLDVLADHRVLPAMQGVAAASLRTGLAKAGQWIVDPVLPLVDDGPLIVAASGPAAIVPWSLLPGLRGRAVSVSPSVTAAVLDLQRLRRDDHEQGVLAVAGPDIVHGLAEAETVAQVYRGSSVLVGPAATGRAVLDAMPAGGLLHIAAHGHHEPDNPLFSGVMLADGLLYGYDVAPNPALPAQVVLSSCDVGRTVDRPGGEPLGLVAALLRSGVSTVVAGTSRVSDEVAAEVMQDYHQRLRDGRRPAVALAGAIERTSGGADYPAPFTCFGAGL